MGTGRLHPVAWTAGLMRIGALVAAALGVFTSLSPVSARDVEKIQHEGTLIVCANAKAMPVSGRGERPGYQLEIAQELARDIDVRLMVEWIWADFQTRHTDCDMVLGVARDPKPGGFLRYIQALSDVEIELVFAGTDRTVAPSDLDGQVIAVPSASLAHFKLMELNVDPRVAYRSEADILAAIADGTLDAGVVSSVARNWYQHLHPDQSLFAVSTSILGIPSSYPMTIGLRKTDSLGESDFQELINAMRDDGRLEEIMAGYGQTLSVDFDNPYAKVPDAVSEPEAVTIRKDIVEDLKARVSQNRKDLNMEGDE